MNAPLSPPREVRPRRIALTGGHGFIGARVTRLLAARGDALTLLVRKHSKVHRVADLPCQRVVGDLLEPQTLGQALVGQEACIHLACVSAWEQMRSPLLERTIEDGTRNILEAAAKAGVPKVVFVSSVAASGGTRRPEVFDETARFPIDERRMRYAASKRRAEDEALRLATERGITLSILRPSEVYGPYDDTLVTAGTLRDVLSVWPALACDGGTSVAHVDDVAAGIVAAMDRAPHGETYLLGGENLTVEELVRQTLAAAGQRKPVLRIPNAALMGLVRLSAAFRIKPPMEPMLVSYATRYWLVSSKKAERELGYSARPAAETLRETVKWLLESGYVPRRGG